MLTNWQTRGKNNNRIRQENKENTLYKWTIQKQRLVIKVNKQLVAAKMHKARQTYKETDRPIKAHTYLWLKKSRNYTKQE
jgi:hypothetical protein